MIAKQYTHAEDGWPRYDAISVERAINAELRAALATPATEKTSD